MSKTDAIQLGLTLLALGAGIRLARAAPAPALAVACLLAWAAHAGILELPRPAALQRAGAELTAWQDEQAGRLSCSAAARSALDRPDDEALALLERHCPAGTQR